MYSRNMIIADIMMKSSFVLLFFYFLGCSTSEQLSGWSGMTMGTTYQVKIVQKSPADDELEALKSIVDSALTEVNHQMSTYDPASEISQFNQFKDTTAFRVSTGFVTVVKKALDVYESSGKDFDITVAPLVNLWGFGVTGDRIEPPAQTKISSILKNVGSEYLLTEGNHFIKKKIPDLQVDLSAIAKGYGVDVVAGVLRKKNYENFMVEIGGEVYASGNKTNGELWKIGIDSPNLHSLPGQKIQAVLSLKNIAVATSGDYRNYFEYNGKLYSHTINPKSGYPVTHNLASVTVIAPNCMQADALATAIMVMGGEKGMDYIEKTDNAEAYFISRKNNDTYETVQSSGFKKYLNE